MKSKERENLNSKNNIKTNMRKTLVSLLLGISLLAGCGKQKSQVNYVRDTHFAPQRGEKRIFEGNTLIIPIHGNVFLFYRDKDFDSIADSYGIVSYEKEYHQIFSEKPIEGLAEDGPRSNYSLEELYENYKGKTALMNTDKK